MNPSLFVEFSYHATLSESTHGLKMKALFELLDQNIDGTVDFDEFQVIADSDVAKTWLAAMDVETDDLETLFMLIDVRGHGHITLDELIGGVSRIKGYARSIDVMKIIKSLKSGSRLQRVATKPALHKLGSNTSMFSAFEWHEASEDIARVSGQPGGGNLDTSGVQSSPMTSKSESESSVVDFGALAPPSQEAFRGVGSMESTDVGKPCAKKVSFNSKDEHKPIWL